MYNGIGLLTPRGSGTSGHVQSNAFNIRSNPTVSYDNGDDPKKHARVRKADEKILEHERKRQIELKLLELAETLEENG
jgi:serine/arginine repetitive matrix protein 2